MGLDAVPSLGSPLEIMDDPINVTFDNYTKLAMYSYFI